MSEAFAWHGASRTPSKANLSQAGTPSRSSRRSGFLNLTHYNGFKRSDGQIFQVGDAVEVWEGTEHATAQVWLDPYRSYGARSSQSLARAGGSVEGKSAASKRKGKAKMAQRQQEEDEWIADDGLDDSVKFGILVDLFEDETGNMRATLHWLARPRLLSYLFGQDASKEEGLNESHSKELVYTFDPSEALTKSTSSKNSWAEDTHDVSYIHSKIRILSHAAFLAESKEVAAVDENTFFIRKALNTKAEQADGWFYDVEWQDLYEKASASGNWELHVAIEEFNVPKRHKGKGKSKTGKGLEWDGLEHRTVKKKVLREVPRDIPNRAEEAAVKKKSASMSQIDARVPADLSASESESSDSSTSSAEDEDDSQSIANLQSDEENNLDLSGEETPSIKEDTSDDEDVFGPVTASGRKRKLGSQGKDTNKKSSPRKRRPGNAFILKPSAATIRKADARALRQKQRLAERQARRLKPRLHFLQQRHSGVGLDGKALGPFEKARAVLHVGCTPEYLPCRDEEYAEIEAYLEDAIDEGIGSCIYIAGVPGTGKTATVRSVVTALQSRADQSEIKAFRFLELNGMKITDPVQSFSILWEFISGNRVPAKTALANLETHFRTPNPGRDTCVVLVDELDQLVTKKQEVIYNFFNWPNQAHSRLIVLAIANTMDLPERELSNKINSRLGSNRINFAPYNKNQLIEILTTRIEGLDGVFAKEAIGLVASKVAGVTGDARRALDICRRAVEKVEAENSDTGKKRVVTAGDIVVVHKDMTSSGLLLFVKRAGLHQRIMLLALSRAVRKVGVADEVEFGDVIRWHLDFCRQTAMELLPTHAQLFSVLHSLADMKLITTEGARLDYFQRVQANVRDDELELVLRKEQRFTHYLR